MKCSLYLLDETAVCEDNHVVVLQSETMPSVPHVLWNVNWSKSRSGVVCTALGVSAAGYQYPSDVKGCEKGRMAQLSV